MNWNTLYVLAFWTAVASYMWYGARKTTDTKLHGKRPSYDAARLAFGVVLVMLAVFASLLITIGTASVVNWKVADVNVLGSLAFLLTTYLVLVVALAVSRRAEGSRNQHPFMEGARLMATAIAYIALMLVVIVTLDYLGVPSRGRAWPAAIIMAVVISGVALGT